MPGTKFKTVDEYFATLPRATRKILKAVRDTIRKAAPSAEEKIAYNMPAFVYNGPLVYYAAHKSHIGFYATPTGHKQFEKELSKYKQGKGSVQFPLDGPMPLGLISRIVKFRLKENAEKIEKK
jgi:uncharacterized protein YdhG (YjbR/CyaY superfamily)